MKLWEALRKKFPKEHEGKPIHEPLCLCGEEEVMHGMDLCESCWKKLQDEFTKEFDQYYGSGKNL